MKKLFKIVVLSLITISVLTVTALAVADTEQYEAEPLAQTRGSNYQGYDIGSYGWSSPEEYSWNTNITYSVARYKNFSNIHGAGNRYDSATVVGGGWVGWYVHCVSDGQHATSNGYLCGNSNDITYVPYYDTYGTTGYTNKLHMFGHNGSMGAGIYISKACWCPDGNIDVIDDYIEYKK